MEQRLLVIIKINNRKQFTMKSHLNIFAMISLSPIVLILL
jgi:hypothetical protein